MFFGNIVEQLLLCVDPQQFINFGVRCNCGLCNVMFLLQIEGPLMRFTVNRLVENRDGTGTRTVVRRFQAVFERCTKDLGDEFIAAVTTAQAEFDNHQPNVVVGSSRGGAVAMNINSGDGKLVLLCPAWKNCGTVETVKPGTVILHSRADDVIPFADLEELAAMLRACEEAGEC